jgi:hypothetical protein
LWSAQLAAEWTPEQQIVGTAVGAPASEVASMASRAATEPLLEPVAVGIVAGFVSAYPEALANLGQVLTPAGLGLLGEWDGRCFPDTADHQGPYVAADAATVEPLASLVASSTAGTTATAAPLLIFHGDGDREVPLEDSDALLARLCAAGQVVERRVLAEGLRGASEVALRQEGVPWLTALLDGTTTPISSCPT